MKRSARYLNLKLVLVFEMVENTFFENISVYNYFRKNNEDTFFLENLILFKNDVLIIFSKISGFCSISQFSKEKWFVELKTQFF